MSIVRKWLEGPLTDEKISRVAAELYAEGNGFATALADDMVAFWARIKKINDGSEEGGHGNV
jgi:hypothetical protein